MPRALHGRAPHCSTMRQGVGAKQANYTVQGCKTPPVALGLANTPLHDRWPMPTQGTAAAGIWQQLHMTPQRPTLIIEAVRSFVKLETLSIERSTISDLTPLSGGALQDLSLGFCTIPDLTPLGGCAQLRNLSLWGSSVSDLRQLQGCAAQIQELNIGDCTRLSSLEGLQACGKLEDINISGCANIKSLAPLSACTLLRELCIYRCTGVTIVEPLQACSQLERLVGTSDLSNLSGLAELKAALPQLRMER
jgi:Leucine-rich repeat (LRR) protein